MNWRKLWWVTDILSAEKETNFVKVLIINCSYHCSLIGLDCESSYSAGRGVKTPKLCFKLC